jgi:prepilin-type N-terminal cleavage/methylation domain-containing protein
MWSGRAGFTLLEAVAALAVVGLAAVAALAAVGGELRTAERARRALEAGALAEYRTAAVRMLPPGEVRVLPDSLARGRFAAPLDGYRWTASTRELPEERDLFDLQVQVVWATGAYTLRTRIYAPERGRTGETAAR